MSELKPCPFCGGKAGIIQRKNMNWDIGCSSGNLLCFGWICLNKNCTCEDGCSDKNETIQAWNTRRGLSEEKIKCIVDSELLHEDLYDDLDIEPNENEKKCLIATSSLIVKAICESEDIWE